MSRIGNRIIEKPQGVSVEIKDDGIFVKGPKGELQCARPTSIDVKVDESQISLSRSSDDVDIKACHGLYNALINNMVIGVSQGYKKSLELIGVGYKAKTQGNILEMSLGFSHLVFFGIPPELKVVAETVKGKNPTIHIEGIDKQLVGQVAAKIRSLRKPEPYKGKGIRYLGEHVRRKAGKAAAAK